MQGDNGFLTVQSTRVHGQDRSQAQTDEMRKAGEDAQTGCLSITPMWSQGSRCRALGRLGVCGSDAVFWKRSHRPEAGRASETETGERTWWFWQWHYNYLGRYLPQVLCTQSGGQVGRYLLCKQVSSRRQLLPWRKPAESCKDEGWTKAITSSSRRPFLALLLFFGQSAAQPS